MVRLKVTLMIPVVLLVVTSACNSDSSSSGDAGAAAPPASTTAPSAPSAPTIAANPAPTLGTVSPVYGIKTGGTAITINGSGFLSGASVSLGTAACASVVLVSAAQITCITPPITTAASVSISVTNSDSQSVSQSGAFTYFNALAISPGVKTLAVNNTFTFLASGGVPPYVYSKTSGSINAGTGLWTAPGSAGSGTVTVTDSLGSTSSALVTVNAALAISPATKTLSTSGTFTFTATGGVAPYVYSTSSGSINSSSGLFTAPVSPGTSSVTVTDSLSNTSQATVTISNVLTISPSTKTLAVGNAFTFSATGGTGGYTYSVITAGGGSFTGAVYTAPATAGTYTVKVTDGASSTSSATVTVNAALAISPGTKTVAVNNVVTFSATGGVSPYSYSKVSGSGTITTGGSYTAPATSGTDTVQVTDSLGNTNVATVTVNPVLAISPTTKTLPVGNVFAFSATGGAGSNVYTVVTAGGGSFSGASYTAPGTPGTFTVRVTDSMGNLSSATVTVTTPLSISPSSQTLAVGNGFTFTGAGGSSPYTFSVTSGVINSSSGYYTAPGAPGSATVTITDSAASTSTSSVTITAALTISPTAINTIAGNTTAFFANGGVSPYTFSVIGGGSISSSGAMGTYIADGGASDTVRITDALGNTANASTIVRKTISLAVSSGVTCALVAGGTVECWGYNGAGGLGNGTWTNSSTPVLVGGITTATAITAGSGHACALLTGGSVKCWGQNMQGQLGNNSTSNSPNPVTVSGITTATAITAGDQHTCAVLSSGSVQCWGQSLNGELGNGSSTRSLVPVNVTGITTATAVVSAQYGTLCALLSSGSVQCWGFNNSGQLGNNTTTNSTTPVIVSGLTNATSLIAGYGHYCAVLSGGAVKCWGSNDYDELGFTTTTSPFISAVPATMPVAGITTATSIAAGFEYTCATFLGGALQCWGFGSYGELGNSTTTSSTIPVNVSGISTAAAVFGGDYYACAILSSGVVKCWGKNGSGVLGNGTTTNSSTPVPVSTWQ